MAQAQFDLTEQNRAAASANVTQAKDKLAKAQDELGYTQLRSPIDGVVTAGKRKVGQTRTRRRRPRSPSPAPTCGKRGWTFPMPWRQPCRPRPPFPSFANPAPRSVWSGPGAGDRPRSRSDHANAPRTPDARSSTRRVPVKETTCSSPAPLTPRRGSIYSHGAARTQRQVGGVGRGPAHPDGRTARGED